MLLVEVSLQNLLPLLSAAVAAGGWLCRWGVAAAGRLWFVFFLAVEDFLDCVEGVVIASLLAYVCAAAFW